MDESYSQFTLKTLPVLAMRVSLAILFFCLLVSLPFVIRGPDAVVLGLLALFSFILVVIPVYSWKDYDIFEPLTWVILMTVMGCSFKLFYVLAFTGRRDYVDQDLLNGERPGALIYGTVVVITGLACFMIGYWRRRQTISFRSFPLAGFQYWSRPKLAIISAIILVISGLAFIRFAESVGASLTSLESFSQKRFIDLTDLSGRDFREETLQSTDYYYYRVAAFAKFAFFLNLAWLVRQNSSVFSLTGLITIWSGFQTIAVFVFMNSRASVALTVIDAVIITYYLAERIRLWKVAVAGGLVSLLVLFQLGMRAQQEHSVLQLVEKTIAGRDLMDVTKMALIIDAVPQRLDFCHGETLFGWLAAPIPKSIWPHKPLWSERGVYVNQHVYGARTTLSGITLGLPTELYWNFGWIGVCLGMYVTGVVLRNLYTAFLPFRDNPCAVVIYSLVVTRLTLFTLGSDLGTGILKSALDIIPIALLILMIRQPVATTVEAESPAPVLA